METYAQVRDAAENGNMICRIDDQSCGAAVSYTHLDVYKRQCLHYFIK